MKQILIVVPFRNREEHLKDCLNHTPKYFRNQNISFDVLITELDNIGDWNRGICCNSLINFNIGEKYSSPINQCQGVQYFGKSGAISINVETSNIRKCTVLFNVVY